MYVPRNRKRLWDIIMTYVSQLEEIDVEIPDEHTPRITENKTERDKVVEALCHSALRFHYPNPEDVFELLGLVK
jgi:Asp-tRNA(Asn)/Glu-tRNA(Gln) amidotransferase C subunit